ncbi:SGNH/GDSL hydrolase family protein [Priestia aryabhattai]|uniref:SGNH/GDSL hydrolase family protein n=1 Tax=Priestia aryabhattai TaxID=412384 RepID=UPI002E222D86|nr:SGNH/GDSL hydrolase family protein [Priestia aryabhattai]MED4262170.1 SGNH/GDSL hydrolase family protein [Priestia aryabhattai]
MGITLNMIGDSITNGTGASSVEKCYALKTYTGLKSLGRKVFMVKTGLSGLRSDEIILGYKGNGGKCDPELVTIMVGANDILQSKTVADFKTNLKLLIDDVRNTAVTNNPVIVLCTILWQNNAKDVNSFNIAVKEVATEKSVLVCETYPAFNTASSLIDEVHPNDSGHQAVANILVSFLNNLDVWKSQLKR